jgi:catechol 2,3-dioxygenase-like lactoylglutathione lyase family enzyme
MMMNARMKQVILYVKDMSKAVFFYRDVLGLEIKYPSGLTDYSEAMWVELDAGSVFNRTAWRRKGTSG